MIRSPDLICNPEEELFCQQERETGNSQCGIRGILLGLWEANIDRPESQLEEQDATEDEVKQAQNESWKDATLAQWDRRTRWWTGNAYKFLDQEEESEVEEKEQEIDEQEGTK